MNDVGFVEAARVLATRMMTSDGKTPEAKIDFGFRLVTAAPARDVERKILLSGFEFYHDHYSKHPKSAEALIHIGESLDNVMKVTYLKHHYPEISLFVQTNPAFCCPSMVTEAMRKKIEQT